MRQPALVFRHRRKGESFKEKKTLNAVKKEKKRVHEPVSDILKQIVNAFANLYPTEDKGACLAC
jgi:hypothetical protein